MARGPSGGEPQDVHSKCAQNEMDFILKMTMDFQEHCFIPRGAGPEAVKKTLATFDYLLSSMYVFLQQKW